jgi:GNAT superfamily N-acetyltransferase
MSISVESFTEKAANQYKKDLAKLRIRVFRDYPYLYDGSIEYEEKYLETFIQSEGSIIVVAFDREEVIGVSTGIPLKNEPPEIKKPWIESGADINKIYYFSESVLLSAYRGRGIGIKFFEQREHWAKHLKYEVATFCGVIRAKDDPNKPKDYVPLDKFWMNRGYQKKEGLIGKMSWKEINEWEENEKKLQFWYKALI